MTETHRAKSPEASILAGTGLRLDLGARTHLMGVVNCTPDSFYEQSRYPDPARAVEEGLRMEAEGADLLDVGGESTRPGSEAVSLEEELRRVVPVVRELARQGRLPVSVDTTKAAVARAALEAGARVVNDVSALLFDPDMPRAVAESGAAVVLMHMRGRPRDMQEDPRYGDVVAEVGAFLRDRVRACEEAGIARAAILLDPGIGFGKTLAHNLELLRRLDELLALGRPILVGVSRKSFLGKVLDLPAEERLEGSAAAVAASILKGARMVRVHDVAAMRRVARVADAIAGVS